MIHTNIFEFELNFDKVVGEVRGELNELIPEIFYELIVDVGDPRL